MSNATTSNHGKRGSPLDRDFTESQLDLNQVPKEYRNSNYVPVSFAAKDWNVSPRRIRSLLAAKRLYGRRLDNGYWEVAYPYHFVLGTRGPVLKRSQRTKKAVLRSELRLV